MITFFSAIILLLLGYFIYGKFIEKIFKIKPEKSTPAYENGDGVDYVPMDKNKNSLIQILNIAGVGPIFGPILGALYGPIAFIWIVIGAIFAGAVHDYMIGMISIRNSGLQLPALAAKYLGKSFSHVVNFFALLLLLLVGTVFVVAPSKMINELLPASFDALTIITSLIFIYYIFATILPVDKIIGKIYPFLGILLLISAVAIGIGIFIKDGTIPEINFQNMHPEGIPYYPLIFLTISCGALSGFHATQSPIISRTLENEKDGRIVFYGMMIAEAIIAMIWAAAAMVIITPEDLSLLLVNGGPATVVNKIATVILGSVGGTIAIIGVIVLPITSGDTSFRAARMIIADYLKIPQKKLKNRFFIALPLFIISFLLLTVIPFDLLWRYFSWSNQVTAAIALWVATVYLYQRSNYYLVALIPAFFITSVVLTFIIYDSTLGFGIDLNISVCIGVIASLVLSSLLFLKKKHLPDAVLED